MSEQSDPRGDLDPAPALSSGASHAVSLLAAAVEDYRQRGGMPDGLASAAVQFCKEARRRGFAANAALAQLWGAIDPILADSSLTASDRAAFVAIAVGAGVHAFHDGEIEISSHSETSARLLTRAE